MRAVDPFAPVRLVVTIDRETFDRLLEEAQASGLPAASRAAAKLLREILGTAAPDPEEGEGERFRGHLRLLPPPETSVE